MSPKEETVMPLTAVVPHGIDPRFQKNAWDPITREPCYPTTVVGISHNGVSKQAVYPNSASKLNLIARWANGGRKLLGKISPELNYILDDRSIPSDASFIIA